MSTSSTTLPPPELIPPSELTRKAKVEAAQPSLVGAKFDRFIVVAFCFAIFTSACLLFVIQPMVGKILLPKLGGAPAVWNTCMVFFQGVLLAGYLAAHLMDRYCSLRTQLVLFAVGLVLALQTLPIAVGEAQVSQLLAGESPTWWMLTVLASRVAPAFFVLSMTSPLLQRWFALSGHRDGKDPYFLYAASNVGSILALLAYPFWIEAHFGVVEQTVRWMYGFGLFKILAVVCGVLSIHSRSRRRGVSSVAGDARFDSLSRRREQRVTWGRRGYWVLLAFVPSSLMLGVTTYVSTDVSSFPMIWVIPLTMYLLTFVLAFSSRRLISTYWMGRIAGLLTVVIMVTVITGANHPPTVIVPMHLLMFFAVALFCHQRLAGNRPGAEYLTDFYLCLSVGGVLGGLFNAIVAPSLFVTVIEYPMIMVLAACLRETREEDGAAFEDSIFWALGFGAAIFASVFAIGWGVDRVAGGWIASLQNMPLHPSQIRTLLVFGIPAALVLHKLEKRKHFALGLAALLLVSIWSRATDATTLQRDRNFYGTVATATESLSGGDVVKMFHGNTVHGWQWMDSDRRQIPLTYYGQSSGVGQLIAKRQEASAEGLNIGAVGMGAGTLAAVLRGTDSMCYYEINPQVVEHAEEHFTYLSDARERGATLSTKLGDARLVLESEFRSNGSRKYDLLAVDAFSSDSIPAHLITSECMEVYLSHLKADGAVAIHITNRYLNLEPVLARLAKEHDLFAVGYHFRGIPGGHAFDEKTGETASHWVLLAKDASSLEPLIVAGVSKKLESDDRQRLWTDDYSNVLSAFEAR